MSPRYHVTADWPNVFAENERDAINQCFWAIADNSHRLQPAWTVEETTPSEGGTDERDDG